MKILREIFVQLNHPVLFIISYDAYQNRPGDNISPMIGIPFYHKTSHNGKYQVRNRKDQVWNYPGSLEHGNDLHYHIENTVKEYDL